MGRPKIENPMSERITIRMNKETASILDQYCEKKKLDRAEGVRDGIHKLKGDLKNE